MENTSPLRVVAIGGGTGLSALLQGLKLFARQNDPAVPSFDITAIVTVTDDGGSSGRLRREFDVLPPGDIRNCMVALSEDSALLSRLFQYRFSSGRGLKGHSFGNLFLMALTHIMGDFSRGRAGLLGGAQDRWPHLPLYHRQCSARSHPGDGTTVVGETRISRSRNASAGSA